MMIDTKNQVHPLENVLLTIADSHTCPPTIHLGESYVRRAEMVSMSSVQGVNTLEATRGRIEECQKVSSPSCDPT